MNWIKPAEEKAPARRDIGFHILIGVSLFLYALIPVVMLCPKTIGYLCCAFGAGCNIGVVAEYSRVKRLDGWKAEKGKG